MMAASRSPSMLCARQELCRVDEHRRPRTWDVGLMQPAARARAARPSRETRGRQTPRTTPRASNAKCDGRNGKNVIDAIKRQAKVPAHTVRLESQAAHRRLAGREIHGNVLSSPTMMATTASNPEHRHRHQRPNARLRHRRNCCEVARRRRATIGRNRRALQLECIVD